MVFLNVALFIIWTLTGLSVGWYLHHRGYLSLMDTQQGRATLIIVAIIWMALLPAGETIYGWISEPARTFYATHIAHNYPAKLTIATAWLMGTGGIAIALSIRIVRKGWHLSLLEAILYGIPALILIVITLIVPGWVLQP